MAKSAETRRVCKSNGRVVATVMHPALMLRGVQARFTDPQTGAVTHPASRPHKISDYVTAAIGTGLSIAEMNEHIVDQSLAAHSPRAQRYFGWPMLHSLELRP